MCPTTLTDLHRSLNFNTTVHGLSSLTGATPQPALSPYLKPLPAPPVDAEVLDLQAQVSSFHDHSVWLQSVKHKILTVTGHVTH